MTLAALAVMSAPPGAVAIAAEAGSTPVAGATDGAGSFSVSVAIAAPAGGSAYRAGKPVALRGGASAAGQALPGTALHWVVVRHAGAVVEQVAEATGTDASFTTATGSAHDTTYEVRLTATADDGSSATAAVTLHDAAAPATIGTPLNDVSGSLKQGSPAFGIAGAIRFSGPVLKLRSPAAAGATVVAGSVRGLATGDRVQVALRRRAPASGCRWWSTRTHTFVAGSCTTPRYVTASLHRARLARATWRVALGAPLPAGDTGLQLRILDANGAVVPFARG